MSGGRKCGPPQDHLYHQSTRHARRSGTRMARLDSLAPSHATSAHIRPVAQRCGAGRITSVCVPLSTMGCPGRFRVNCPRSRDYPSSMDIFPCTCLRNAPSDRAVLGHSSYSRTPPTSSTEPSKPARSSVAASMAAVRRWMTRSCWRSNLGWRSKKKSPFSSWNTSVNCV